MEGSINELILQYRYWVLIPLLFIEGPIVAFFAGALAALGYFNPWALMAIFFVRDVAMDVVYYLIGYHGAERPFVKRALRKVGVTQARLQDAARLWGRHPGKMIFLSKLSYGIASAFIMIIGVIRMPFRKFLSYSVVISLVQYGGLLALGYFLGNSFGGSIAKLLSGFQYAVLAALAVIVAYYAFTVYIRRKALEAEEEAFKD